jgi:hypothetical protein
MSVSNCSASGADSYAQPITGAVVRKDKLTGAEVPAGVRGNGLPSGDVAVKPMTEVNGVGASSDVMSVLLGLQGG